MALELPTSLSPSKVSTFTDCALAFRFSSIDRLPEPPSAPATKGTLVHAALERLFVLPAPERTLSAALTALDQAIDELRTDPEFVELELDVQAEAAFLDDAEQLVRRYFEREDPTTITPIGIELKLEASIGDLRLRGIIDRLELDDDGELVVTDYKTGKVPHQNYEQGKLGGVHFYAFLCERLFGRRPADLALSRTRARSSSSRETKPSRCRPPTRPTSVRRTCSRPRSPSSAPSSTSGSATWSRAGP